MKIRVAGISGSPRKGGNTEQLVQEALKGAREVKGVETVFLSLAGKKIQHCTGCLACEKRKQICVLRDEFRDFFQTYMEADGIILGSPIYHLSIPSKLKPGGQLVWRPGIDAPIYDQFFHFGKLPCGKRGFSAIKDWGCNLYSGKFSQWENKRK
jgi:NAD(P)H-dependent FMN reductase